MSRKLEENVVCPRFLCYAGFYRRFRSDPMAPLKYGLDIVFNIDYDEYEVARLDVEI
jgi:hypothetical protein